MRRKNLPRYHSFCVNDTTQMLTRKGCCTVRLNAAGRVRLLFGKGAPLRHFTVPAPKGYAMSSATQFHQPCALCKVSTFCFFIIAFQHILSYFISIVKGFGRESGGISDFFAFLLRMGAPQRGALCNDATSWHAPRSGQETRPDFPSGASLYPTAG